MSEMCIHTWCCQQACALISCLICTAIQSEGMGGWARKRGVLAAEAEFGLLELQASGAGLVILLLHRKRSNVGDWAGQKRFALLPHHLSRLRIAQMRPTLGCRFCAAA